jgi:hypothetical protein
VAGPTVQVEVRVGRVSSLLGKGYCSCPEGEIAHAHDLVDPDQVKHMEIIEASF